MLTTMGLRIRGVLALASLHLLFFFTGTCFALPEYPQKLSSSSSSVSTA
ncbi:hypothetical protein RchiOBHm_Chr3g0476841 [Rosa chinensis]|uniref:Uncharacterized protein n=1 Tax=Rosa chinensis TaxID=74649 RepID=A0A2P6RCS4_ROSCH|nr:hypothetical protein RchiOBHm_Chr3g0476841 [Rosa chinensis]